MTANFRWPSLGVGLGFRTPIHEAILANRAGIDWLEFITEDFLPLSAPRRELIASLRADFTCIPHGTELSVGSGAPISTEYLEQVAEIVDLVQAPFFSDHLCFTTAGTVRLGHLAPVQWTRATATDIAAKARLASAVVGAPLLLENIAYHFVIPGELTETQFIESVLEQSGCGLLLDVTNVYTNSVNTGFDPFEFLDSIPIERLGQLHVAGGKWDGGTLVDSHDAPVPAIVWELVRHLTQRVDINSLLVERDADFPDDFDELLVDMERARAAIAVQAA